MSSQTGPTASRRLTWAAFAIFALLTAAVVASEARSAQAPAPLSSLSTPATSGGESLLIVRIAQTGLTLGREWLGH